MRILWIGGSQTYYGHYFNVVDAQIYTRPEVGIPIIYSAYGPESTKSASELGDGFITTGPNKELIQQFLKNGKHRPEFGQMSVCYAPAAKEARDIVVKTWPLSGFPSPVNSEFKIPLYFENLANALPEESKIGSTVLGADVDGILESIKQYEEAGMTHVYIHNIGPYQEEFLNFAEKNFFLKSNRHRGYKYL